MGALYTSLLALAPAATEAASEVASSAPLLPTYELASLSPMLALAVPLIGAFLIAAAGR